MFERYVRDCCVNYHSLLTLICRTFEESMQSEHLYLLFRILANLSKILSNYLPLMKRSEIRFATFRHLSSKSAFYSPNTPAQKHPYLMMFQENLALSYQMTAFLLLRLAYG